MGFFPRDQQGLVKNWGGRDWRGMWRCLGRARSQSWEMRLGLCLSKWTTRLHSRSAKTSVRLRSQDRPIWWPRPPFLEKALLWRALALRKRIFRCWSIFSFEVLKAQSLEEALAFARCHSLLVSIDILSLFYLWWVLFAIYLVTMTLAGYFEQFLRSGLLGSGR